MNKKATQLGSALKIQVESRIMERSPAIVSQVLSGLGQIMLQENAATGLLFLIGIFYGSVPMGLAALVATLCGTITARALKYDRPEIDKGLYGFSAALVGVGIILFLKPVFASWLFIIAGSVSATVIQHFFIKRQIPVFTLPFVLVTWFFLFLARYYFPQLSTEAVVSVASVNDHFTFAIKGFGQVIFQDNVFSGILFFIAVFISSPIAALYGLAAAVLSGMLSLYFSVPIAVVEMGLFSYNGVLCAIVFAGIRIRDGIWVLVSVLLSLVISVIMSRYHLIPLTFPFVAASCIVAMLKYKFSTVKFL